MKTWLAVAFLLGGTVVAGPTTGETSAAVPGDPLIGAIRWDAWSPAYSYSAPSTLTDYSYREPSLGWYNGGVPHHRAVVDAEIDAAADHGLDYWSFVWYPETAGVQQGAIMSAFNDYYASPKRSRIQFTFTVQTAWVAFGGPADSAGLERRWRSEFVPYFVAKFRDPQYVKVNGNRPLVYWFDTARLSHCDDGFCTRWREELTYLRDQTVAAGLGEPFLVDNTYDGDAARRYGLQAVTSYGPAGARPLDRTGQVCWSDQAAIDRGNLTAHGALLTVPALTPVNDGRPRGHAWWVDQPTYGEWEAHVQGMVDWARAHPGRTTNPPTVLTYAWNELDEGGAGILPSRQNGTMFLDAIRAVETGQRPPEYRDVRNDDNCRLSYAGSWTRRFPVQGLFNNDEQVAGQPGALAQFTGAGVTGFEVAGVMGPDRGFVQVLVDGVPEALVDLYALTARRTTVFGKYGMPAGSHTLTIVATGTGNPLAGGTLVGVDTVTAVVDRSAAGAAPDPAALDSALSATLAPPGVALRGSYRSSSQWDATQGAGQAFDGRYDSNWQAAAGTAYAGSWLEVDFGRDRTFDAAAITEYGHRTSGFLIQYWSGGSWRTAYAGTSIGDRTPAPFTFPAVRGSKARIYFTSGVDTPIVYELEVYSPPASEPGG